MKFFYTPTLTEPHYTLSEEESRHCIKVLRMVVGDELHLSDGRGLLCRARIVDADSRGCVVEIVERFENFEKRQYALTVAVAPTKNNERLEWFVEKAVEVGIDRIVPLVTDHSERCKLRTDRLEKIAVSAMKQSLKAFLPQIDELTDFRKFVSQPFDGIKLIAHCEENVERTFMGSCFSRSDNVLVLIGPEGDFSPAEIELARQNGFREVTLGQSRLRTETAALTAVMFVAFVNN